jgi:hypothetical protein
MFSYSPPGGSDDLAGRSTRDRFLRDWHGYIHDNFVVNIGSLGPSSLFFSEVDETPQSGPVGIGWNGFPLSLLRGGHTHAQAWEAAEHLQSTTRYTPQGSSPVTTHFRPQDEYCEWHAYSEAGKLKRIVFTAEGPEYWVYLAGADFDAVVDIYRRHVSPAVQPDDLRLQADINFEGIHLSAGDYNPFNRWNTADGAMHLTHPANTLGAEINLAAFATVPHRDRNGQRVDDVRRLICCAGYGNANRSSDPSIGFAVNTTCVPLASGGAVQKATLANPVGLYMKALQTGVLTGPNGESLDSWFRFVRGQPGSGLMAVLEAPAGATFGLDKVKVKNVPLQWGGQVAEAIDMVLYARTSPSGFPPPSPRTCTSDCCMPAGTQPQHIKDVNLTQIDAGAGCGAGGVPSYPELEPTGPKDKSLSALNKSMQLNVGGPKLRTRLAGE